MTDKKTQELRKRLQQTGFWILCVASALVSAIFLTLYLILDKGKFTVDNNVLILLFATVAFSLLPFLSKVKIGGLLEIERLSEKIERVKSILLRGEVVRLEQNGRFYIDNQGNRYSLPDDRTAQFLRSPKGEMVVTEKDVEQYPVMGQLDSVLDSEVLKWDGHVFVLLNGKKYHVGSASFLADWGRTQDECRDCDAKEIRRYPSGR
jgi:hypothetical protein